ncbi:uncharacterized protein LOC123528603 [Mercenaria mercenaria]|uniref:uncharacterized protein LOC123528603 n=1 Tax=Mercenaria mercenaria TaxID=6596 RepID=UPI00234FA40F|nr:uncharacterized protein LOC123528603 [Mercenaria mercenaria]
MKNLMEFKVYLFSVLTVAYGCSEPEGGYKEPTPADNVFYSKHVVVGEVTELLQPDPIFEDMYGNSTYGAMVTVRCTYKGGPLPGRIQIGGAGYIPGHCSSKDLEKGKKYVLFLRGKEENGHSYEQSQIAVLEDELKNYLNVCDLHMQYPEEKGMALERPVCPAASKLDTCKRHGEAKQPKTVEIVTVKSKPVYTQGENTEQTPEPVVGKSKTDEQNTAMTVMTSLSAILVCVVIQLMM